ncbi:LLM class flavin-dependent oxidoreductase [Kocuria sp.]|uniref:LLM class flavin-dependent oxidoreductase n=1 Tax=Kocuria sp. TaxID=1871328 RepID=UPI0026E0AF1F|nr:LLM class flavin-dependent oxidoreductase [Kocuria sp.]MDO5618112.1 LLM class flavin-dependent oxidoreductase [Kocuria sp.]
MALPLSVLDFATVRPDHSVGEAFQESVSLAQVAEKLGYTRVWYTEHHNMGAIASAAPAVLIAHVATQTTTIRLGSGGVMLPNHSPLTIAEQFGTLAELHPNRIDLGLGRAPGTDQVAVRAMRRDPRAAEEFPADVKELQGYLRDESKIPGIRAIPGAGTNVPLYILGSSLFGARLAAAFGLPYAFASHFAPDALEQAAEVYRAEFEPSEQLSEPYMMAAVNVVAHRDPNVAVAENEWYRRNRVKLMAGRGRTLTDDELDLVMHSAAGQQILHMLKYTAVGDGAAVKTYLEQFAQRSQADELIVAPVGSTAELAEDSLAVLREAWGR